MKKKPHIDFSAPNSTYSVILLVAVHILFKKYAWSIHTTEMNKINTRVYKYNFLYFHKIWGELFTSLFTNFYRKKLKNFIQL